MLGRFIGLVVWLGLLAALFVPLERQFALRARTGRRRGLGNDLGYYFLSGLLLGMLLALPAAALAVGAQWLLPRGWSGFLAGLPLGVRLILALVVGDFGAYWGHRLSHRVPLLWRYGRLQFQFAALDLCLFDFDLRGLFDLLHAGRFGDDLLLHHVGLDVIGFVGRGLLCFDLGIIGRFLQREVALKLSLLCLRECLRLDARLIGLRFGDSRGPQRGGLLDLRVAGGQRGGDIRFFLDALDLGATHIHDIIAVVAHFFDRE